MADSATTSTPFEGVQVAVAMGAGVAAWLVTYLLTYVIAGTDVQNNPLRQLAEIPTWKGVGYVFYNAHFVDVIVDLPLFGGEAVSFVGGENGFTVALFALPPAILVIAGLAVGRAGGTDTDSVGDAAVSGATLAVGYVVPSLLGVFVFGSETVSVVPVTATFVAGVIYPLLFGALGGVLAHVVPNSP